MYNPANAKRRIETKGYTYNHKTRFYEKGGETLSLHIQTPATFVEKQKIARVIVEQLKRIGIRATWANLSQKEFFKKFWQGDYQARIDWQSCGSVTDPWSSMDAFTTTWATDGSEDIKDNPWHWRNKEYTKLVNEMGSIPLKDKKIALLFNKAIAIWMNDLPIIPITQANKILPFNHAYWTNWPSENNPYIHPPMWWQSAHIIIHNLKKAQTIKLKDRDEELVDIDIVSFINPPYVYRLGRVVKGLSVKVVDAVMNRKRHFTIPQRKSLQYGKIQCQYLDFSNREIAV